MHSYLPVTRRASRSNCHSGEQVKLLPVHALMCTATLFLAHGGDGQSDAAPQGHIATAPLNRCIATDFSMYFEDLD
jgi:hypothetical protein